MPATARWPDPTRTAPRSAHTTASLDRWMQAWPRGAYKGSVTRRQGDDDMLPSLHRLGESLHEAARRQVAAEKAHQRRRRRLHRRLAMAVTVLVLLITGAAGATQLIGAGRPVSDRTDLPEDLAPRPGQRGGLAAQTSDPGGSLPWGVRIYTSRGGAECAVAGQRRGARLGVVEGDRFRPLPPGVMGACGNPGRTPLFFDLLQRGTPREPRTVVYGRARRGVERVQILGPDGRRTTPTGDGGAFLFVYGRRVDGADLRLSALG